MKDAVTLPVTEDVVVTVPRAVEAEARERVQALQAAIADARETGMEVAVDAYTTASGVPQVVVYVAPAPTEAG